MKRRKPTHVWESLTGMEVEESFNLPPDTNYRVTERLWMILFRESLKKELVGELSDRPIN